MSVRIHPHESHGAFVNRYVITTDIQIFRFFFIKLRTNKGYNGIFMLFFPRETAC